MGVALCTHGLMFCILIHPNALFLIHSNSTHRTSKTIFRIQMYSLEDGQALLKYHMDTGVLDIGIKSAKIHQERLIVGLSNRFHIYDVNSEKPIARWQRPPWSFNGRIGSVADNVCFDGAHLIFVQDRSLHLYDFLHPCRPLTVDSDSDCDENQDLEIV